tara:strand:+ start:54700 stop:54897 length:198 start_codon:yes stop_codon:yes gene_type:complete
MRHKKLKREWLNYVLIDKTDQKAIIYRFKTKAAEKMGVSVRTLDRNTTYETEKYIFYTIKSEEIH